MTNEQAIKDFEGTNENYRDQLSKYGYVMDKAEKDVVNQIIERNELAISALSADGEYVKKEDILNELGDTNMDILTDEVKEIVNGLPSYSFPETAKPDEGAELIDRRQIKWYGCDHEGHIKGINCETADCSKCFHATVEHDEVMSLPVYRIPDSADIEKIQTEILEKMADYVASGYANSAEDFEEYSRIVIQTFNEHIGG